MGANFATVEGVGELLNEAINNTVDELAILKSVNLRKVDAKEAAMKDNEFWEKKEISSRLYSDTSIVDTTNRYGKPIEMVVQHLMNRHETVSFGLNAQDISRQDLLERFIQNAKNKLHSRINQLVIDTISRGSLAVKRGAPTGYDDLTAVANVLDEAGAPMYSNRFIAMTSRQYNALAKDVATRANFDGDVKKTYGSALLASDVAGFNILKTQYTQTLNPPTVSATVNGANQRYTFVSPTNNGKVDSNSQVINITVASGALTVGSYITIAGVNSVNMAQNGEARQSTGVLKTFRVNAVGSGNITISPPIICDDAGSPTINDIVYKNVSATPANGAAITVVNTTAQQVCPFWIPESLLFTTSYFDTAHNKSFETGLFESDLGITYRVSKDMTMTNYEHQFRVDVFLGMTNIDPERNGVLLFNQS